MSKEELFSKINIALTRINNYTSIRNETYIDKEVLQELLNYIDKLEKENEALKEENFDQVYMKAIADYKDKIRDKIKDLEVESNYAEGIDYECNLAMQDILNELLEEE